MRRVAFVLVALAACTDTRAPITGTQSLQVTLGSPADPGTIDNRLPDSARTVSMTITALGPDGKIDTTYNRTLGVYVQFLGTLTPYFVCPPGTTNSPSTPCGAPLATVQMNGGMGSLTSFSLPPVFGPTRVWFEDSCYQGETGSDAACADGYTYATGTSPTLWFRDPFIADIRNSELLTDPFGTGPIDNKNVSVLDTAAGGGGFASRFGAKGRLVITSVYAQGFTLADVECQDNNGTPPCTYQTQPGLAAFDATNLGAMATVGYDSIDVYSYSAPLDQEKRFLSEGQVVDGFAGGVSEFDGLLEIGFPQTFYESPTAAICGAGSVDCDPAREPAPVKIDQQWFTNIILFKRFESATLEVDNWYVCPLDSDYAQYKQWKLSNAPSTGPCSGNVINVITTGIFDPTPYVGQKLAKVIGNERSVNIGSFHVWIIYPRSMNDISLQ